MKRPPIWSFSLLVLFWGPLGFDAGRCPCAWAETLKEFMETKAFKKYKRQTISSKELYGPKWFKTGSNFQKLFISEDGPRVLLDWLAINSIALTPGPIKYHKQIEYVGLEKQFSTHKLKRLSLTVLVPHPKFLDSREAGLLKPFFFFEPPALKTVYGEELDINSFNATMHQKGDGSCSLLLKLTKGAIVNIAGGCNLKSDLINTAKTLDLKRLNEKLNS